MSPEITSAIQTAILAILTGITAFVLPTLFKIFKTWGEAKETKIRNDERRANEDFAMLRIDRIVSNVVKEIQQTKVTNKVFTGEDKTNLLKLAFKRVKGQLTDDIVEIFKIVVKEPDRYLITKIEAAVGDLKLAKTTAECK